MPFISSVGMYFYLRNIIQRLIEQGFAPHFPQQLTINYYESNEGLFPHTDNVDIIKEWVIGISLLSSCIITFSPRMDPGSKDTINEENDHFGSEKSQHYLLRPGSIMIQSGEARYSWKHGISPSSEQTLGNVSIQRQYRISLQLSDFEESYFDHPETQKLRIT